MGQIFSSAPPAAPASSAVPQPAPVPQRICKYHPPAGHPYEPHKITLADNCICMLEQQRERQVRKFPNFAHFPTRQQRFLMENEGLFNEPHLSNILYGYYSEPLKVGDYVEGGVVFYIDQANRRALVSAIRDVGFFAWGPDGETKTNEEGFFSGKQNTDRLCVLGAGYAAAVAARGYSEGVYRDWYLPSKDELYEMYKQRAIINQEALRQGGAAFFEKKSPHQHERCYWSSSAPLGDCVWDVFFGNGGRGLNNRRHPFSVRSVRAFNY